MSQLVPFYCCEINHYAIGERSNQTLLVSPNTLWGNIEVISLERNPYATASQHERSMEREAFKNGCCARYIIAVVEPHYAPTFWCIPKPIGYELGSHGAALDARHHGQKAKTVESHARTDLHAQSGHSAQLYRSV